MFFYFTNFYYFIILFYFLMAMQEIRWATQASVWFDFPEL